MNRTLVLFALVLFGFAALGYTLYDRFSTGAHTRVAICHRINSVKKILRDEHEKKLERSEAFLAEHPNGIPGISRELILQGIEDEKTIIAAVQPDRCR